MDYEKYLAAGWEIYIGDSPVWHENPICPGDPLLKSDYKDYWTDAPNINREVAAYGFKKFCNMPGKFTFFVARTIPSETITLCNVAVLGTTYNRDEPLETSIEVQAGSSATLSVPHVHADDTIGNVLAIDLRLGQDSDLTSV